MNNLIEYIFVELRNDEEFFFYFFLNEMANLWVDGKKKAWAIESYRRTYPTTVTPAQVCVGLNLFF